MIKAQPQSISLESRRINKMKIRILEAEKENMKKRERY